MARFWLFGACMAAAMFFALSTFGGLPQTVARHFATNGAWFFALLRHFQKIES